MNEKSLICRIDRRMKALLLAIVMIVTTITVPVHADENANPEENVVVNFVEEGTTGEGTVIKNPEGTDYIFDSPFVNNDVGDKDVINNAFDEDSSLTFEIGLTIDEYTCTSSTATPQVVIYAMDFEDSSSWKQAHYSISETGETCELSLSLKNYKRLDLLGFRIANCDEGTTVKYTMQYARVIKKTAAAAEEGVIATLVEAGTKRTGKVEANAYAGDNPNSKNILNERFDIPWNLKTNLNAFKSLKLQVGVTITDYTATEAGVTDDDAAVVLIYSMNDEYGDWKQHQVIVTEKEQTVDLELDLLGYEYLGEFGLRFGGFDLGSNISYTINYAKVIGDDGGSSITEEVIPLRYTLTGETKEIPLSETPVGQHGKLSVKQVSGYSAPTIVDKNGEPYQLRGASTHGFSWFPKYINEGAFHSLRDEWGMNLVRLAVYAREGGYTTGAAEAARDDELIQKGVEAATKLGMYVIIDWHVLNYNPNEDKEAAKEFFTKYVEMYKDYDNVLFEICNEPTGTPWYDGSDNDLYSYCKELTGLIREGGSDAIVLCGTNQFSSEIDKVAEKPLSEDGFTNVMYNCHFYAASHREAAQQKLLDALEAGTPVFISEFGICTASGDGRYDAENADKWLGICDENNVSYACWAMSNSQESAAYFKTDCEKTDGGWVEDDLKNTARFIINYYRDRQEELAKCKHSETEVRGSKTATCKEEGYTGDTYCKICNELLVQGSKIPKTQNHVWNAGTVTESATASKNGVKTFTCTVCGTIKTETIPATGTTNPEPGNNTVPKNGTVLKSGKNSYKVTKAGSAVAFTKTTSTSTKITIPATVKINNITYKVTSVANNAFKNNKKIKTVTIGKNVTTIGVSAFSGCKKLTKVTIGANVTTIGKYAFYNCISLKNIKIPSKVKTIGASAFRGCKKLATITIKSTKLKSVGKNTFKNIKSTAKIKVPSKKLKAYKTTLKKKGQGSKVKIVKI